MGEGKGRGQISSIEALPDEADLAVAWAAQELRERKRTAVDIHAEFNHKLADLGLEPISSSAFGRHSMAMAQIARRIEDTRAITQTLTERLEPGQTDDLTIMVAETIKTLVFELLNKHGEAGLTPKDAMEMASALKSAVNAQKVSSDRRRAVEADLAKKVDAVLDKVSTEKGLPATIVAQLRKEFFGMK
ncbi:MAG: hypothetical protein COB78_05765 [Hyphomicrobiales bacterium]|nr:MAG: hypothetical protein COB78_05765 [Hyphomicrobiales bacterium]